MKKTICNIYIKHFRRQNILNKFILFDNITNNSKPNIYYKYNNIIDNISTLLILNKNKTSKYEKLNFPSFNFVN